MRFINTYHHMKTLSFRIQFIIIILSLSAYLLSCTTDKESQLKNNITQLEQVLVEKNEGIIDGKLAANMILAYTEFVDEFPEDQQSPDYLFKAADVSINVFHSQQTIKLFNRVINEYPKDKRAAQALFLKAFTFDNYMQEYDSAKIYYEEFLIKYPQHSFANDAEMSLENLGKSPEEIVKGFDNK